MDVFAKFFCSCLILFCSLADLCFWYVKIFQKSNDILIKYCIYNLFLFISYDIGTLRFGKFDVTETQLSIIFLHLMSAVFGTGIWDIEVSTKFFDSR